MSPLEGAGAAEPGHDGPRSGAAARDTQATGVKPPPLPQRQRQLDLVGVELCAWRIRRFRCALRSARNRPESQDATIEVWQGGEYICCLPPDEGPSRAPPYTEDIAGLRAPRFSAAEHQANRVAQVLLPVAGLLFWLALLGLAFAASFGWRVALH